MRSLYDSVKVLPATGPMAYTGTGTATAAVQNAIDTKGFTTAMFVVAIGTATGTTVAVTFTLDAKIMESADGSTGWTDVSGAAITQVTTVTGSPSAKTAEIQVEGLGTDRERYLKCVVTTSVTPALDARLPVAVIALLGRGYQEPVDNSATGDND